MRYGMNMLLWTADATGEKFLSLFERLKKMGFDSVEIPIMAPDVKKCAELGKRLENIGLMRTALTVLTSETNLIGADKKQRRAGVAHLKDVYHANFRMMYDTFHANIEEKDITEALSGCAEVLIHVHVSENDRSTPGKGAVNWKETFAALKTIPYKGSLTIEAFGPALPELAAATKIWRRMFEDEEQLAKDGLVFT